MLRLLFCIAISASTISNAVAEPVDELFGDVLPDVPIAPGESERVHPFGETPLERINVLAHTDSLPECDKVEIYTVRLPPKRGEQRVKGNRILAEKTLGPDESHGVCDNWRKLTFDRWKSAFCHYPPYGIRFYHNNELIYETTVCWECSNFLLPDLSCEVFENEEDFLEEGEDDGEDATPVEILSRTTFHGFQKDKSSDELLALLRKLLPHPELDAAASKPATNE
jgi:hypothetical protein